MDSFLLAYIAQRMGDLGFKKWSMEPILVVLYGENIAGNSEYVIEGQNEYYFLASKLADQVEIYSDDNYYKSGGGYIEVLYSGIQEFTGQIRITYPNWYTLSVEFIRVIPQ
jgi:hypothetical protein